MKRCFKGSPDNVLVSGSKITMTVPSVRGNGEDQTKAITGVYSVRIKQSAGVTNPASGGSKTITLQENAPDGDKKEATAIIQRVIKLSKTSGTRGTETTATFKGFANGTATVNLKGEKLDEVTIADNVGTLEIDTTSSKFIANEGNEITAEDASGNPENVSATFNISPKVVLDPEATSVSKSITVKLTDWPLNNTISEVKIGNTPANPTAVQTTGAEGKVEFMVRVPSAVNRGSQTLKVTGTEIPAATEDDEASTPSATASLKIGVLELNVQPTTAVPGQEITIQAGGFVAGDKITSVGIGNQTQAVDATANSGGDIVITLKVPSFGDNAIGDGSKTITIKAEKGVAGSLTANNSNREGEGVLEIPKAAISLAPETARRGEEVTVTGSGFPAGDLVQIKYKNPQTSQFVTVDAKAADSAGVLNAKFDVPSFADIGKEHDVEAFSVGVYKGITAKGKHSTPGASLTLEPEEVVPGTHMTISGMNFPAFATVAVMTIGTIDVRPVPAPATSIDGDFSANILVPQMELGNQTVTIRVSSTNITDFVKVVEAEAVTTAAPADAFESSGARLVRVWYLDSATQAWSYYDPNPAFAPFNSLTEVSSGQVVIVIISAGDPITFQGKPLYQGTNNIALD